MIYTIYKITNKVNGKYYIGKHQTKNIDDGYMGSGKLIRRAIRKYGIELFEKEILFLFSSPEEMDLKEAEIVTDEFCARPETYNLCHGRGGFHYLNRNKLNNSNKDKEEIYQRVSNSLKGRKLSDDHVEKMRDSYKSGKRKLVLGPQYGNSYACKKIMNIETGEIFSSLSEAAKERGCSVTYIGKLKRKGKYVVV